MKIGFDNDKYLKIQSEQIKKRISQFGDKLYLEFGGKLFDDNHASRVLPGFLPDSKLRMLMHLRDCAEITYVIVTGTTEEFPSIKIEAAIGGLPVKEIAPSAFQNNYSLYSIEIPDSVTVIGEAAFRNCRSLVSVRLPAGLTELPTVFCWKCGQ